MQWNMFTRGYKLLILSAILFTLISLSCTHESITGDEISTVCFDSLVYPILSTNCSSCHGNGKTEEGFSVDSYTSILRAVEPGNSRGSLLYKVLTNINREIMMPPDHPLSQKQRNIIQIWIDQGANETHCDTPTIDTIGIINYADSICFVQDVLPIFQSSCATTLCHDEKTHKEDLVLTSYNSIIRGINAYQPLSSKYYKVVILTDENDIMPPPPFKPLSTEEKAIMYKWINEGAIYANCPEKECDTLEPISFKNKVFPKIDKYCVGCHNSAYESGKVNLDNYDNIKSAILKQKDNQSLLLGCIRSKTGFKKMPPVSVLDECTLRSIELWVDQGMKNE